MIAAKDLHAFVLQDDQFCSDLTPIPLQGLGIPMSRNASLNQG